MALIHIFHFSPYVYIAMAHPPEAEATVEAVEEDTVEAAVGVTADHLTVAEEEEEEDHRTETGEDPLDTAAAGDKAVGSAIRTSATVSRTSTLANRSWSPLKRISILSIQM